jgi:hypothetical protein
MERQFGFDVGAEPSFRGRQPKDGTQIPPAAHVDPPRASMMSAASA